MDKRQVKRSVTKSDLSQLLCAEVDCEGWGICPCRTWRKDMGFSLEHFFEELIEELKKAEKGQATIENILKEVEWQQSYAKECGQLK